MLHGKDPDFAARTQSTHGFRHMEARPFLAHDDWTNVLFGATLDDRIDRVGVQSVHALLLERLRYGAGDLHRTGSEFAIEPNGSGLQGIDSIRALHCERAQWSYGE